MLLVEDRTLGDVNAVSGLLLPGHLDKVADLALQANVADQTVPGLRVHARHIAGVWIAVRISIGNIEIKNEFVAAYDRADARHWLASSPLRSNFIALHP